MSAVLEDGTPCQIDTSRRAGRVAVQLCLGVDPAPGKRIQPGAAGQLGMATTKSGISDVRENVPSFTKPKKPAKTITAGSTTHGLHGFNGLAGAAILGVMLGSSLGSAGYASNHAWRYWRRLPRSEKITYIEGYTDAMRISVEKFAALDAAANTFHWKRARKILGQVSRELDFSGQSADDLMHFINILYSEPRYRELELGKAMQLAVTTKSSQTRTRQPK